VLPRRTSPWAPRSARVSCSLKATTVSKLNRLANLPLLLGELVFGVARIFASFNDTFVHVTDLRFV
jgi:hypothetical protein